VWKYLHRPDCEFWTADNHLRTPVLVLDQFEEVFSRSGGPQSLECVFQGLGELSGNKIPSGIACDKAALALLDMCGLRYRVVVAFREDYLADVRAWTPRLPSLLRHWTQLLPMTRSMALTAVTKAGQALLAKGEAASVVDFAATQSTGREEDATVDPVMLSLCCTRLNNSRSPDRLIDGELLRTAGDNILEDFYVESMQGMPDHVHRFVEDYLVQGRSRGSYACTEAVEQNFVDAVQLERLTSVHRVLQVDPQSGVPRIELVHDRLVDVVRKAHDKCRAREADSARRRELAQQRSVGKNGGSFAAPCV
jgi:hypothetical protein